MSKGNVRAKAQRALGKKFDAERRRDLQKRAAEFGVRVPDLKDTQEKEKEHKA